MSIESRELIRNAVAILVAQAGGGTVERPMFPGRQDTDLSVTEPEPLAAIRAALALQNEAGASAAASARLARETGRTWAEIGEVLYGGTDLEPAGRETGAFYCFAGGNPGDGHVFPWVCRSCFMTVMDRGPENGHPADCEPGHADGCARLAAAVAAYEALWRDE